MDKPHPTPPLRLLERPASTRPRAEPRGATPAGPQPWWQRWLARVAAPAR